jgi:hypothetical protein
MEAREVCRELWLRADLSSQTSNGVPLCDANSKLSARLATAEEAKVFSEAAKAAANSSDDLMLAYLVELDACRPSLFVAGLLMTGDDRPSDEIDTMAYTESLYRI